LNSSGMEFYADCCCSVCSDNDAKKAMGWNAVMVLVSCGDPKSKTQRDTDAVVTNRTAAATTTTNGTITS